MGKNGKKWRKVAKGGGKVGEMRKIEENVGKSWNKWGKVGKIGKSGGKVGNSGKKRGNFSQTWRRRPFWMTEHYF